MNTAAAASMRSVGQVGLGASPLMGPVIGLCGWTLVMEVWLYALRLPALMNSKLNINPNMTKEQMNSVIPRSSQWAADNFAHLSEQPTQFYATALALAFLGANDKVTVGLAWGYVGLRVLHSLIQAIANPIMIRFRVFALSSLVLAGLTVRAVQYLI